MWLETKTFHQDMEYICASEFIPWECLRGKTIFVTGATGLIGYTLVSALLYASRKRGLRLRVLALARDEARTLQTFASQLQDANDLSIVAGSVDTLPVISCPIDYIVHGAGKTASMDFVQKPVETIQTALHGTEQILELARAKHSDGVVYLSSMEVYGHPMRGHKVTEDEIGALSPLDIRNSYPISKVQCESLCRAYAEEYNVPTMILRLTQTFGPGVREGDQRIFAEFARCVREKRDIVLKTKGETERSYLYTADAATAILTVLLKGQSGSAYNAADESTYCSIADMAEKVAAWGGVKVRCNITEGESHGYLSPLYMDLDTGKLKSLGWNQVGHSGDHDLAAIITMYDRMLSADGAMCKVNQ